jgi:hypothetical protein
LLALVGSGGVVVWNLREKRRYTQGEQVSWMKMDG